MKLIALEGITDQYGIKKGFGTKKTGEIFEVADEIRALEVIASGGAKEYKESEVKPQGKD